MFMTSTKMSQQWQNKALHPTAYSSIRFVRRSIEAHGVVKGVGFGFDAAVDTFVFPADVLRRRFCVSGASALVQRLGFCVVSVFSLALLFGFCGFCAFVLAQLLSFCEFGACVLVQVLAGATIAAQSV